MKKTTIKKTGDTLYYDTLDNGLQIFMIPKKDVNNALVTLNVRYGAVHNEFIPLNEDAMRKNPNGIAHFLEHKMFEQENGVDPMLFYAANGADVNAYTSLYNTAYHFSCSSHMRENLEYLLDFVQAPYFTDENVDKEKGIIEEEIKMYNDDPYTYLEEGMRFNVLERHPLKHGIAGSVEDINSITKEDLYTCYTTFYHPSNMFVVVSGNFDPDNIFDIIKDNQAHKSFDKAKEIVIKKYAEPNKVVKTHEDKAMNVEVSKISLGLKIPLEGIDMEPKKRDLYLSIIFDSIFGSTSVFNEEMKEKGYLLSYISVDYFFTDDHLLVTISADTEYKKELLEAINNRLSNLKVDEDDFNNKVRVMLSANIYAYEDIDVTNRHIVNDLIRYGKYYPNDDELLEKLSMAELISLSRNLNIENKATSIIKPLKEE